MAGVPGFRVDRYVNSLGLKEILFQPEISELAGVPQVPTDGQVLLLNGKGSSSTS